MQETITQNEVRLFGDKLAAFGESLSDHERTLLCEILIRAATEDDVEGHSILRPAGASIPWSQLVTQVRRVANLILENSDQSARRTLERPYINHRG
ncbi:MAG TPA: hypothetical protein VF898_05610 [Chloroflexota bacterium]